VFSTNLEEPVMEIIQGSSQYFKEYKLNNPLLINGMKDAIFKIVDAVNNREKIVVYGCGDVDSICGISILLLLLKYLNADVEYFIPDDTDNKIGISKKALNNYIKYLGADLLITVGCGSNSKDEIRLARQMGINVIVTDNHEEINSEIEAIVINSKNKECEYPFKYLSSSGTVFKLCEAISMYYTMKKVYKYIDLVMIGTLASKEPIKDENKALIDIGIENVLNTNNYGIKALLKINNISKMNMETVAKLVNVVIPLKDSPRNMDNARIAVELFTTRDSYRAIQIAKYLKKECLK
jgi:single-stranded DNA-specific DHH superfamily exonuclease